MRFYIPADFVKSEKGEMRICGFASTPDLDRENEQVVQKGLDISEFLEHGFFNYNHDNSYILGYPDKNTTKVVKKGLYVEGNILPTPMGIRLWDTAMALKKSNAPRKLGFSIEGKVLERGKNGLITKAKVYNVAITSTPVNPYATWQAVVKSMIGTDDGSALMQQSLEHATRFFDRANKGDEESITILKDFMNKLNQSKDTENIKLYLAMFKGYFGEDLLDKTKLIERSLEG